MAAQPTLAIFGGTGALARGLARRWARAGYPLILGSRSAVRATAAAQDLENETGARIRGLDNLAAAEAGEILVLAVPFAGRDELLATVKQAAQGKILVDATVPLSPPVARVSLPAAGSAAKAAQELLGENVRVVSAFQNVAAHRLGDPDADIACDVLVCGDDPEAREQVISLVEAAGLRGWHAGRIENAAAAEALTSVLIFINRRYDIDGAGLRITGESQTA